MSARQSGRGVKSKAKPIAGKRPGRRGKAISRSTNKPRRVRTTRRTVGWSVPAMKSGGGGEAVLVVVVRGQGTGWEVDECVKDGTSAGRVRSVQPIRRMTRWVQSMIVGEGGRATSELFAALGHPVRLVMLRELMNETATYAQLRDATGQKAGPMYHHIKQLRLAGLIRPKQRDVYSITRAGRCLLLAGLAAATLAYGRRRDRLAAGG